MRGKRRKLLNMIAEQFTKGMPRVKYAYRVPNPQKPNRRTIILMECTKRALKLIKRQYRSKVAERVQRDRNTRQARKDPQTEAHA